MKHFRFIRAQTHESLEDEKVQATSAVDLQTKLTTHVPDVNNEAKGCMKHFIFILWA